MISLMSAIAQSSRAFSPRDVFTNPTTEGSVGLFDKPNIFYQDLSRSTPASSYGDPVKLSLDANSIGKPNVLFLNGSSGTYASTPDRAGLDITGDIDIRARVAPEDWTPSTIYNVVAKFANVGQRSYFFRIRTDGALQFTWSSDGTSQEDKSSTVATGFADGSTHWIRCTQLADNGASGHDLKFYTSDDDTNDPEAVTWTQLGATVTTAGTATIFSGTDALEIGSAVSGTSGNLSGQIYSAQVYDGIDGTLVADFNAANYPGSGSTIPDGVSGDWTRQGNAYIAGEGYHLVAPSDATRMQLARTPYGGRKNRLDATATLSTQNVTSEAIEYTLSFTGTGTVTLSGTSTAGPLVGTGANDRVTLTFTPTAGTLTLTVSGTVTDGQLEPGDAFTSYQNVVAAYDVTESGVPSVDCLYGNGTTYASLQGSKVLIFMHDGTGGYSAIPVAVNKVDDGANDYIYSSRITGTNVGAAAALLDSSTNDAKLEGYITNGTSNIAVITSANDAIERFTPQVAATSYNVSSDPDADVLVNQTSVASGDDTGTPSTANATYDITLMAGGDGNNILPGYLYGWYVANTNNGFAQVQQYFSNKIGVGV